MVDLIRWLKGRPASNTPGLTGVSAERGFVYVGQGEAGPMASASAGKRVRNFTDRPPWIVVDHTLQSPILARWPGRLWRVRILRKAPEQPLAYAAYTRATAVHVEEELPLSTLFDHDGEEVVRFLSSIRSLSVEGKAALSGSIDERAASMHNEVWDRWLSRVDASSPCLGQDQSGVLAMGAKPPSSPVGSAPSVLRAELAKRAREMDGEGAFITVDEEQGFTPDWSRVATHLQHALFAIGAPAEMLSVSERAVLASAYVTRLLPTQRDDA